MSYPMKKSYPAAFSPDLPPVRRQKTDGSPLNAHRWAGPDVYFSEFQLILTWKDSERHRMYGLPV